MARRHPNHRLVKIHRNYTVDEVARTLLVHKNTVRNWISQGLPTIDGPRPTLVFGRDLFSFLETRRKKAKQKCPPGHFYCVKCRLPQAPAGDMVDYIPLTATSGNLRGICPECETLMHRRVALKNRKAVAGGRTITVVGAEPHIRERAQPCVTCDFVKEAETHEDAQSG